MIHIRTSLTDLIGEPIFDVYDGEDQEFSEAVREEDNLNALANLSAEPI